MSPGAFKHTAEGMHALKPDPVNTAAGQSRDKPQDTQPRTNHTPPDVTRTHRDRWESLGLNPLRVISQDTERER